MKIAIQKPDWMPDIEVGILTRAVERMCKFVGVDKYDEGLLIRCGKMPGQQCAAFTDGAKRNPINIVVSRCCLSDMIDHIAHEMIHVRDILYGDLLTNNDKFVVWKGEKFPWKKNAEANTGCGSEAKNLPWEIEAYARMDEIAADAKQGLSCDDRKYLSGEGMKKQLSPDEMKIKKVVDEKGIEVFDAFRKVALNFLPKPETASDEEGRIAAASVIAGAAMFLGGTIGTSLRSMHDIDGAVLAASLSLRTSAYEAFVKKLADQILHGRLAEDGHD